MFKFSLTIDWLAVNHFKFPIAVILLNFNEIKDYWAQPAALQEQKQEQQLTTAVQQGRSVKRGASVE